MSAERAKVLLAQSCEMVRKVVACSVHHLRAMHAAESPVIPAPRSTNGFRVAAECRPADEVAGDFYVVAPRGRGRVGVVIGDACGRGRQGAALLPEILPRVRKLLAAGVRPGRLLAELNRAAVEILPSDRFITAAALELDAEVCTLTIANAGHVPALTRGEQSVAVVGRASGPPLGILPTAVYPEQCVPFKYGDTVVLMTDGVLEAVEEDLCGMHTLQTLLSAAPVGAEAVHHWIFGVVDRCLRGRRADDVTLLCIDAADVELASQARLRRAS